MLRLGLPAVVVLAMTILWVYCILDVIATDEALIRNLPKMMWLLIVIFIPQVGSIAWLALGRPPYAGWRPGDTERRTSSTRRPYARGPEDDPTFIPPATAAKGDDRLRAWEDDLARRERELRRREGEGEADPDEGAPDPGPAT